MSLTLRPAHASDLEAMTAIAIAAYPYDPQWPYRYPHREKYPDDHHHYVRLGLQEYFTRTAEKANKIMLVEAPDKENPDIKKVIAYGIWDNPGSIRNGKAVPPSKNHFERRDGDAAHMKACVEAIMAFRQEVFVERYGDRQMSLRQIATHPDYWRCGAGHLIVDWGVREAIKAGVAIVLFAGPTGKKLYETFGFRGMGTVHVHCAGEKESLDISAMAWDEATDKVVGDVLEGGDIPMDQSFLKGSMS